MNYRLMFRRAKRPMSDYDVYVVDDAQASGYRYIGRVGHFTHDWHAIRPDGRVVSADTRREAGEWLYRNERCTCSEAGDPSGSCPEHAWMVDDL